MYILISMELFELHQSSIWFFFFVKKGNKADVSSGLMLSLFAM